MPGRRIEPRQAIPESHQGRWNCVAFQRCLASGVVRRLVWPVMAAVVALVAAGCTHQNPSPATAAPTTVHLVEPSVVADDAVPDHYDRNRHPAADLARASTLSAADGKEVLLIFGSDWCPDCRSLEDLLTSAGTESLLRRYYHVVLVDVGKWDANLPFTARYVNLAQSGIPALAVVTPSGIVREATNDGSFADARTMSSDQVDAFLTRWAPVS